MPSETSPASRPGFRIDHVERLFARLSANYGARLADMWRGVDLAEVKAEWGRQLAGMPAYRIVYALEHLPKWPPSLPEFRSICLEATPPPVRLPDADAQLANPATATTPPEEARELLAAMKDSLRRMAAPAAVEGFITTGAAVASWLDSQRPRGLSLVHSSGAMPSTRVETPCENSPQR